MKIPLTFENLPNLEELVIDGFFGNFKDNLTKTSGYFEDKIDRWKNIKIDFSSLHELKKLKKIKLSKIKASLLNRIVALPAAEKLEINSVFYIDKEMNPDDKKEIQKCLSSKPTTPSPPSPLSPFRPSAWPPRSSPPARPASSPKRT